MPVGLMKQMLKNKNPQEIRSDSKDQIFKLRSITQKKNQKYFPNSQTLIFRVKYGFQNKYKAHI